MVKIAVVILNYNGRHFLEKFLSKVIERSPGASVIVSDNKSTDDSVSFLRKEFPTVRLIELDKNHGFAGGYNETLRLVDSEYYVLLNSDVEVSENWLEPMIDFLDANNDYAACQPKIKDYQNKNKFEYAGACGGFIDILGYPYCRGRIFDQTEIDIGQYDEPADIFWSSGACMMIRAKDFHHAGAFDSSFFAHMEEIDLCWRLNSLGRKIRVVPKSTVFHVGGGTLSYQSPFKTYLNFRNGLKLLIKNLPLKQYIIKIPLRVILDWVAAVIFLLQGNGRHAISVLKSHLYFFSRLSKEHKKRRLTSQLNSPKSVVWNYFIKNRKTFQDQ